MLTIFWSVIAAKYKIWAEVRKKSRIWSRFLFGKLALSASRFLVKIRKESRNVKKIRKKCRYFIRKLLQKAVQNLHFFRIFQNNIGLWTKEQKICAFGSRDHHKIMQTYGRNVESIRENPTLLSWKSTFSPPIQGYLQYFGVLLLWNTKYG